MQSPTYTLPTRFVSTEKLIHVRPVLEEASFFVLSLTSEGVSLTLLEAMASGLPVRRPG